MNLPEHLLGAETSKSLTELADQQTEARFFPTATTEQKMEALFRMVMSLHMDQMMNGQRTGVVSQLFEVMLKLNESTLSHDERAVDAAIEMAMKVVDLGAIDVMAQKSFGLQSSYHRQLGLPRNDVTIAMGSESPKYRGEKTTIYMTPAELQQLLQKATQVNTQNDQTCLDFDAAQTTQYLFPETVSVTKLKEIKHLWNQRVAHSSDGDQLIWIVPFLLNEEVAGVYRFTFHNQKKIIGVRSELPVIDVLTAFIEAGVSEIGSLEQLQVRPGKNLQAMNRSELDQAFAQLWQELRDQLPSEARTRLSLYLKRNYLEKHPQTRAAVVQQLTRHYTQEFSDPNFESSQLLLTRSGVSANGVAMEVANHWINQPVVPTFEGPGWYYENSLEYLPDSELKNTPELQQARVLLLNTEPNGPQMNDSASFFARRTKILEEFLASANQHPDQRFAIVVDKTTDPAFTIKDAVKFWPPNIRLLETMSLTKNQRGGRERFYGLIEIHGAPVPDNQIEAAVLNNRGTLTLNSLIAMPKVTRSEVLRRRERVAETVERLVTANEAVAKQCYLLLEQYSYYFFVYPDLSAWTKKIEETGVVKKEEIPKYIDKKSIDTVLFLLSTGMYPTLEKADSFNLNTTRLTVFDMAAQNTHGVLRISPGVNTPFDELQHFLQEYIAIMSKD